ncbi:hypothetical protein [Oceaniglobus roseus]|uniref:hypothetical protein n=1 Tax=Oceaniglobus roseus TaxID=1737570 RepID=UPI000C7E98DB|nr:hypothetical protein [Kandeliimicrobium roseum]
MTEKEIRIVAVEVADLVFDASPPRHRARVRFLYDLAPGAAGQGRGSAGCLCQSRLPADAPPEAVRADLVQNGLGQLRRMPEVWRDKATWKLCVDPRQA